MGGIAEEKGVVVLGREPLRDDVAHDPRVEPRDLEVDRVVADDLPDEVEQLRGPRGEVPEGVLAGARREADQHPLVPRPDDAHDGRGAEPREPGLAVRPHDGVQLRLPRRGHQVAEVGLQVDVRGHAARGAGDELEAQLARHDAAAPVGPEDVPRPDLEIAARDKVAQGAHYHARLALHPDQLGQKPNLETMVRRVFDQEGLHVGLWEVRPLAWGRNGCVSLVILSH